MDPMQSEHVKAFEDALLAWTDHRFISADDLHDLAIFSLYLVNLGDSQGWQYYGHTHKQNGRMGVLVVKANLEGVPYVVFTSAPTYMGCVRIFLRKCFGEMLEWVPDRYRG